MNLHKQLLWCCGIVLACCSVTCHSLHAKEPTDSADSSVEFVAYPFAFYTPETDFGFGAAALMYFRLDTAGSITYPSTLLASAFYTTSDQYEVYVRPSIYFFQNLHFAELEYKYSRKVQFYYGIGPEADTDNADYILRSNGIKATVTKKNVVFDGLDIGVRYRFVDEVIKDRRENVLLLDTTLVGNPGGHVSGIGTLITLNDRDNIFYPMRGRYMRLETFTCDKAFGGDYNYTNISFDYRRYFAVDTTCQGTIAVQTLFQETLGTAPFYELHQLGGSRIMRGYIRGRYRDQGLYCLQAEYRRTLFWRFGMVAFAGIGDVFPDVSKVTLSTIKPTFGIGGRFIFDEEEKINLRADLGFGNDGFGVYFGIGEVF